jgi:hypothetical protein
MPSLQLEIQAFATHYYEAPLNKGTRLRAIGPAILLAKVAGPHTIQGVVYSRHSKLQHAVQKWEQAMVTGNMLSSCKAMHACKAGCKAAADQLLQLDLSLHTWRGSGQGLAGHMCPLRHAHATSSNPTPEHLHV